MFFIIAIFTLFIAIFTYPIVDVVMFVFLYAVIQHGSIKHFLLGGIVSLVVDILWGRVIGVYLLGYIIFSIISYFLYKKYPITRDYSIIVFTTMYVALFLLYKGIFFYPFFSWKDALLWGIIQLIAAFFMFTFHTFFQKMYTKRNYLTTKHIK